MNLRSILFIFLISFAYRGNIHAQTQLEMNISAAKSYKQADYELNKIYKLLMNKLNPSEKNLLIKAQNNWIKFRDSHCIFAGQEYAGGSIQPMVISNCLAETTRERTKNLKKNLDNRSL